MRESHVVIIGGGLSGLSAGCYARASGFRTTILEHGPALGGVCTAWSRDGYEVDGCIHWLTGGPFERIYAELGIMQRVALRPLEQFASYRNAQDGTTLAITQNLDQVESALRSIAPEDTKEIALLIETARKVVTLDPGIEQPRELASLRSAISTLWGARHLSREVFHFRKPLSEYTADHLRSVKLRRLLCRLFPEDSSALFLALMLGYLERGHLSRPVGGSGPFRDALVHSYARLGGDVALGATVDEVLIDHGRARGVRLEDGSIVEADYVISTSSMPETVLHLLGGRYGLDQHAQKLEEWKMYGPLLLVSYGVALPLADVPSMQLIDEVQPFHVGGRAEDHLYIRVYNDEPSCAPAGHTVVQTLLSTDYQYWATRHGRYASAKKRIGESVLEAIDRQLPGVGAATKMVDIATPLTYWRMARSWRGAYEGFRPSRESLFGHVDKCIAGLANFYMAGQWVEPGGGVPVAILSGRQAVQLMCAHAKRSFVAGQAGG